jgi:hypothetical protein
MLNRAFRKDARFPDRAAGQVSCRTLDQHMADVPEHRDPLRGAGKMNRTGSKWVPRIALQSRFHR